MKWAVKLYVAGKLFEEKVHAVNYQDAKETALARNPKAKVVSVNPTYNAVSYTHLTLPTICSV